MFTNMYEHVTLHEAKLRGASVGGMKPITQDLRQCWLKMK